MRDIDNSEDVLDIRDVIARIEELRSEREDFEHDDDGNLTGATWADSESDDATELSILESFVEDFKGYGGDEEWEGDWYPVTLVRDSYFKDYAEELAGEIGAIDPNARWPANCIDWEKAARELRIDYTSGEFAGVTYWGRS